eukprot:6202447-Pleurochrysis_carterae.AAC.10
MQQFYLAPLEEGMYLSGERARIGDTNTDRPVSKRFSTASYDAILGVEPCVAVMKCSTRPNRETYWHKRRASE